MGGTFTNYLAEFESGLDGALAAIRMSVPQLVDRTLEAILRGRCIAAAGNGGAAALASHFTSELVGELSRSSVRAAPILDLTGHSPTLTALANDIDFESSVAAAASVMLGPGDLVLLLSTSGKSKNLIEVAQRVRSRGVETVAIVGSRDSPLATACSLSIALTSSSTEVSQDYMSICVHSIAIGVRSRLGDDR